MFSVLSTNDGIYKLQELSLLLLILFLTNLEAPKNIFFLAFAIFGLFGSHNIFITYLVGGGIIFLSIFLLFWLYLYYQLYKVYKLKKFDWIGISAFNVASINIFIGFVNTSFANENAMLTLLVIAIFISRSVRKFHLVSKAEL